MNWAHQAPLSSTISQNLLKFMSIESVILSNHLILCHPLLLLCLPPFPISGSFPMSQLFASGGQSIGASAPATVFPMNMQGWFPLGLNSLLLAVQGTLKSLLQYHSSKASILQCSVFFMIQLSHQYTTYWKNYSFDYMDLCRQSNVSAF